MKSFIVALCVIAAVAGSGLEKDAAVLRSDYGQTAEGNFDFGYETENGIIAQAHGSIKALSKDEIAQEVVGSYHFKTPEGLLIDTSYIANENGFQVQGAHLPTPPPTQPIPDYIQRSIEYNAAHPYDPKKL